MLTVANEQHLPLIAEILIDGSRKGSWGAGLGDGSRELPQLLAKLRYVFAHGDLPQVDPRTGVVVKTLITGYVYSVCAGSPPVGFGLFKDFLDSALELWMLGLSESERGKGHGRTMVAELLDTPLGARIRFARCALQAEGARRCSHVLRTLGFSPCRAPANEEWLLHTGTPPSIVTAINTMDFSQFELRPQRLEPRIPQAEPRSANGSD
jgi:ribosomal protein S18 acetylase RimI-like enzyme